MSRVRTKSDRAGAARAPEHVAERALVAAAEHVRADVDVEALLLVAGARAADAPVLLDERDRDAGVREEQRRGRAADAGADDDARRSCRDLALRRSGGEQLAERLRRAHGALARLDDALHVELAVGTRVLLDPADGLASCLRG